MTETHIGERLRWENIIVSVMAVAVVCFTGFVGFSVGRVIWDKVAEAVHHPQEYLDAAVSVQVVELDYVVSRSPLSDEGSSDITLVQAPCGMVYLPRSNVCGMFFLILRRNFFRLRLHDIK